MSQKFQAFVDGDGKTWANYFVDVKTNIIYFIKRHKGRRIFFSTHETNGVKAKRFANAEYERRVGKRGPVTQSLVMDEVPLWLKVKESENLKYDTMNNVRRGADEILEFWGDKLPSEIDADSITEWVEWWAKHKSPLQMENAIKYMRNFCKYLARKVVNGRPLLAAVPRIVDPNAKKIRRARKKKKENIFVSKDFVRIYETAGSLENRILALFMYTMASRVTETLELSFDSEIFLDHNPPIYKWSDGQNKADLDGFHALHPSLIKPLNELRAIREAQGTKRLFPQKYNPEAPLKSQQIDWDAWRDRAGISWHWTAHTFRHTCLSNLFNDPKNPQLLICKLYRISLKEAEETYVKPTIEGIALMRDSLRVEL